MAKSLCLHACGDSGQQKEEKGKFFHDVVYYWSYKIRKTTVQKYILFSDFQKIVVAFCFIQATKHPIICFLKKYYMKRILSLTLLLVSAILLTHAQTTRKVLFIGNSYIYTNDLPNMIKTLASDCGDTLDYSQSTPSSYTFQNHLSNATTMGFVNAGGWDNVVLQEQSQLPSFPYSQVQNECFPYAEQLCEAIRTNAPQADIVFFMTWGRRDGDASNCANYPPLCTYEGMDSLLCARYTEMAEQNHAVLSPVGRVWNHLRHEHPEIELYSSDGSHPSAVGSYAAAVTFYTILFQRSPSCISNDLAVDAAAAQAVRETVQQVVYNSLDYWYRFVDSTQRVADMAGGGALRVWPNPAGDYVEVDFGTALQETVELTMYDGLGRAVRRVVVSEVPARIDLTGCPTGLYLLRATAGGRAVGSAKIVRGK